MTKILPMVSGKFQQTMKAVGLYRYLPISDENSLIDLELKLPKVAKTEVLVEVKAISVNPIDTKIRAPKPYIETYPRILGWEGAGTVVATGKEVNIFNLVDDVYFTGDLRKNGSNAQYVALDQIFIGPKPKNLTFEQAAAMPFTTVAAFEALYDRLLLTHKDKGKSLLIINSGGGVGSIATQLAANLKLKVIGTASRLETEEFSRKNGAQIVLNHTKDLLPQLKAKGFGNGVDFILVNNNPYPYWDVLIQAIKPKGKICLIVDNSGLVDIKPLKDKKVALVSEMMATKMNYDTKDKARHNEILKIASKMFDNGTLRPTVTKTLSPINAATLREAHRLIEEKRLVGKLVLSGF
ncbi:Zinc-type alcohol dehydrogenase-like protein [Papilio xuthus]|uniref:Zinc-type alcohol dehydrogenase-like protein n=1 Tax=Papilio xuthus TaxID=66420 RepID=A0A194QGV3_PAPXU|nr:Zinc-type alcohol dehydrogenase-like protein [Papilio xuthus]